MATKKKTSTATKSSPAKKRAAKPKAPAKKPKRGSAKTAKAKPVRKPKTAAKPKTKAKPPAAKKPKAAPRKSTAKKAAPKKSTAKKAAPKKSTAKAAPTKPVKTATKAKAAPRRDATGHLNPKYARELRALSLEGRDDRDDNRAFLRRPRSNDDLAEELGEEAVATMTSGEDQSERLDARVEEEEGGPFVQTRARDEFARGTDKSNPRSATREPFPTT